MCDSDCLHLIYDIAMYKKFKYQIIAFAVGTLLFYGWLLLADTWPSLTDQAIFLVTLALVIASASYVNRDS